MSRFPLAPDTLARFRSDLLSLAADPQPLGVAVSGGPDSLALLLLAHEALPGGIHAATVDHGLRPEGRAEALQVAHLCAALGCPHETLAVTVPDGPGGIQAEARRVRYAALADWVGRHRIRFLATAHHADDQAETLLMRLQRGAGLGGLSGIRPVRRDGSLMVLRPLLTWTKSELVHIVSQAGIDPAQDPSNEDPRYDRTAVRRFLLGHPEFEPRRLARTAAALREANDAIEWQVERLLAERCTHEDGEAQLRPDGLPRELCRRLLARTIAALRRTHGIEPDWSGSEDVEGLLSTLEAGGTGTLGGIVVRGGRPWHLSKAPPRRPVRSGPGAVRR